MKKLFQRFRQGTAGRDARDAASNASLHAPSMNTAAIILDLSHIAAIILKAIILNMNIAAIIRIASFTLQF